MKEAINECFIFAHQILTWWQAQRKMHACTLVVADGSAQEGRPMDAAASAYPRSAAAASDPLAEAHPSTQAAAANVDVRVPNLGTLHQEYPA